MRLFSYLWAITALTVVHISGCTTSNGGVRPTSTPAGLTVHEQEMITLSNAYRTENGLHALRPEQRLMAVARRQAMDLAKRDKFRDGDQTGDLMEGMDLGARVTEGGYVFARIAQNAFHRPAMDKSLRGMMEVWMDSPRHNENLLLRDIVDTGVAVSQGKSGRWYFVQIFAQPYSTARRTKSRMFTDAGGTREFVSKLDAPSASVCRVTT
jgi:uncharacterized protein YkwD